MKHRVKVVMLPTQYIYATVSQDVESIKEGDWCIFKYDSTQLIQVKKLDAVGGLLGANNKWSSIEHCRKIIATDDPKLTIPYMIDGHSGLRQREVNGVLQVKHLPQLHQPFLKEFIANPDVEYEVKYKPLCKTTGVECNFKLNKECYKVCSEFKPKIRKDNTIKITTKNTRS